MMSLTEVITVAGTTSTMQRAAKTQFLWSPSAKGGAVWLYEGGVIGVIIAWLQDKVSQSEGEC